MILDQIVAYKREFVETSKSSVPVGELKRAAADGPAPASFAQAVRKDPRSDVRVIAEVKKASPSKGVIREDFDPVWIARDYAANGAAAISVLTDERFFQGSLSFLRQIRTALPGAALLRKDFTIDEYQIYEARAAGASAILLITAILDRKQLSDYRQLAEELGMAALTEVHLEREADLAAELGARIIGVNNRDLKTFEVDISQTERVMRLLGGPRPEFTFVAESGISTPDHVDFFRKIGVDAMLVGESLMREASPGIAIRRLLGKRE